MTIESIEAAIEKNRLARKRTEKRLASLRQESRRLESQLLRAKLAQHIGGEVVTRYRGQYTRRDGVVGTLVAVRRTRAVVKWDGDGEWTIPLTDILPASDAERRGYYVGAFLQSEGDQ
jgi:hypothetical protein